MYTLPLNFMILQFCGIWRPLLWTTVWKSVLYNCYTTIIIFSIYLYAIAQGVDLIVSFENIEEFTDGSFLLLSMIALCGKTTNFLKKREEIIDLTNVPRNGLCKPRNAEERKILDDCERDTRRNCLCFTALYLVTVSAIILRSIIVDIPERNLACRDWLPYDLASSEFGFWFSYLHQLVVFLISAPITSSFDTLVPGFMMHICAQMKILKCRIKAIPEAMEPRRKTFCDENDEKCQRESLEFQLLTECITHHNQIFRFAEISNDIFGIVIFLQFFVSSLILCVTVYKLSTMNPLSSEYVPVAMCLSSLLIQIFFFCQYGGELTLQSVDICDAIYTMDWSSFCIKTKKGLITMMIRSLRPITFTCGGIITLSRDSFNSLIKLSYSAYNVLQQSSV